ncbi:Crp/Fnr family transcriptional regulator [Aminipila butyrica]|uniref:Crp/Fnr family transcriptional regulator n=1 Tax=Aminipila butyrica TaxID=433296 RepID=A0A858BUY3_9FIRM|nr:Crp/Fnr family transcriptional regulator [Aminipila butyrica]QIB68740.1 Crp/Fnr family transcriptional regulator [Aminipila butyrica]
MNEKSNQPNPFPLFDGIKDDDLSPMLACLSSYILSYQRGESVLLDKPIKCICLILQGSVHLIQEDVWGKKTILDFLERGAVFGESVACGSGPNPTKSYYAPAYCRILFIPFHQVLHTCQMSCSCHHQLIENMVKVLAHQNIRLMEKLEVTSKRSLREKILSYLSLQAQACQQDSFEIPLGRLELANYLCAHRSALSRELERMKQDGLIEVERNTFRLLKKD